MTMIGTDRMSLRSLGVWILSTCSPLGPSYILGDKRQCLPANSHCFKGVVDDCMRNGPAFVASL